jgi:hypothetical protein
MCGLTHFNHHLSAAAHEAAEKDAPEKRRNGLKQSDVQRNEPEVAIADSSVGQWRVNSSARGR